MNANPAQPGATQRSARRESIVLLLLWMGVLLLAIALDGPVAQWVQDHHPIDKTARWVSVVKLMGNYWFTIFVALWLLVGWDRRSFREALALHYSGVLGRLVYALLSFARDRRRRQQALALLFSGALGGLLYSVIKWVAGRRRPVVARIVHIDPLGFRPFPGGLHGLFYESGLGFPSGHACLAFASAMTLTFVLPEACWLWFSLAVIVGAERVLENAHYLSDVVAGAGIGTICGWFVWNAINPGQRFNANR